ncbi:MAG: PaaX family transcriptional regulator C-terminal domain-containing protein [Acidimicrobiales bacterium]
MRQHGNAQRLTARSVIASTLLGTTPPRLPGHVLVRAAELFGTSEGTARVALSRMVAAGELEADDGWYSLTGARLLARQSRQESGRAWRTPPAGSWSGCWHVVIVTAERRAAADRAELRDALARSRLAELREGVWVRPDNLDVAWPAVAGEHCSILLATGLDAAATRALWDVRSWATSARDLRRRLRPLAAPLARGDTDALAEGFVVSAAVLRLLQADPLLPAELLPARWPGDALRDDYDSFDAAYRATLRSWFASNRPPSSPPQPNSTQ